MSAIHLVLQGKGGVGKSLVAALLAQYLAQDKAAALLCADTDPVNDTFARYGAFGAQRVKILNADKNIDARAFDGLIETVRDVAAVGDERHARRPRGPNRDRR